MKFERDKTIIASNMTMQAFFLVKMGDLQLLFFFFVIGISQNSSKNARIENLAYLIYIAVLCIQKLFISKCMYLEATCQHTHTNS